MFTGKQSRDFAADDFAWIAEWGFDFVRLPMSYLCWIEEGDVYRIREAGLGQVDRAVEHALARGLHVNLNFHRAPGFCVNPPREPLNLWKDSAALDAFCFHWELFARRYRHIPSARLSFNLVNEPTNGAEDGMTRADHERVCRAAIGRIRKIDPERLIILDGLSWGQDPLGELIDLGVAQSCRAYWPQNLTHYRASWVPQGKDEPLPVWPDIVHRGEVWNRARLRDHYRPWADLARRGVGVHCGEGGCFKFTPHAVALVWLRDVLETLTGLGIGYALWQFRGPFGILDSDRADVAYEDWRGHKLDRKLLELLQEF